MLVKLQGKNGLQIHSVKKELTILNKEWCASL